MNQQAVLIALKALHEALGVAQHFTHSQDVLEAEKVLDVIVTDIPAVLGGTF
jgi:hypothetical protein